MFKLSACIQYTEIIQWPKQKNDFTYDISGMVIGPTFTGREEEGLDVHTKEPTYLPVRVHQAQESLIREEGGESSFRPPSLSQ